jgi:hypothetical protein
MMAWVAILMTTENVDMMFDCRNVHPKAHGGMRGGSNECDYQTIRLFEQDPMFTRGDVLHTAS